MAYILRVRTLAKACCASYMKNVVGMDVDTSDLDALLADVPDPLAKPAVEEAANVVPACPEPASGGGCPGAAAAAGDHSERAFEFVTIAEDAVSAPSESSESSEKEA